MQNHFPGLEAFVKGPRRVQEILTAIDSLAPSEAHSEARRAMLDVLVELELLRHVSEELFNVLPSCSMCCSYLASHVDKEADAEFGEPSHYCPSCYEDLSDDDKRGCEELPWAKVAETLSTLRGMAFELPAPDPASVVQASFAFR